MYKSTCCSICLSIDKRTIDILRTDLQYVYENLANYKLTDDECWVCYICHTRLRQCWQLQQLVLQTRGLAKNIFRNQVFIKAEAFEALVELSNSKTRIVSTIAAPSLCIKQESDGESTEHDNHGDGIQELLKNTDHDGELEEKSVFGSENPLNTKKGPTSFDEVDKLVQVPELKIVRQSVIDRYVPQSTTQPVCEEYLENWEEIIPYVEEVDDGIEGDNEQKNTTHCEGSDQNTLSSDNMSPEAHSDGHSGAKPFSCDSCSKEFFSKTKLKRHVMVHTGEKPFECDICSKTFSRKEHLQYHLLTHTNDKPLSCDTCFKRFKRKRDLACHFRIHTSEKFSCDICSKKFITSYSLKEHLLNYLDEKPFKCDICSKGFHRKCSLDKHLLTHPSDPSVPLFSSDFYLKALTQKYTSQNHRKLHTGGSTNAYNTLCYICLKSFSCKSVLKTHQLLTHSGKKPYMCDICPKSFKNKCSLKNHSLNHFGSPFRCDICSKTFTSNRDLTRHSVVHSEEKPFTCEICLKSFSRKCVLEAHREIHMAEKQFSCVICSMKFVCKAYLKKHLRKHHT